jgi:hypothetical protein
MAFVVHIVVVIVELIQLTVELWMKEKQEDWY